MESLSPLLHLSLGILIPVSGALSAFTELLILAPKSFIICSDIKTNWVIMWHMLALYSILFLLQCLEPIFLPNSEVWGRVPCTDLKKKNQKPSLTVIVIYIQNIVSQLEKYIPMRG